MSIWTRGLKGMLRRAGEIWTADIDGQCVEFSAVFDQENRLEDAEGAQVLIAGSVLTVESSIAKDFTFKQEVKNPAGDVWYVREVVKVDDGSVSRVNIVESLNNMEC